MNKINKNIFIVMLVTLAGKFLGFVVDALLAYKYGASYITDAYLIALSIPTIIFASIAGGINTSFIPIFTKIKSRSGLTDAYRFSNNVINVLAIIVIILISFLYFFKENLVLIFAPGFNIEAKILTEQLLAYSLFMSFFVVIAGIYSGITQSLGSFGYSNAKSITQNLIIIVFIFLSGMWGIEGIIIGTVIGMSSHIWIQLPYLFKKGYKFNRVLDWNSDLKEFFRLSLPIVLSTSIMAVNLIVDRIIASNLGEGTVTSLTFANKINQLIYGVFIAAIVVVHFPQFAQLKVNNQLNVFSNFIISSKRKIIYITIPLTLIIVFQKENIVTILFKSGNFGDKAVETTSTALLFYIVGVVFYGLQEVLSKAFYALSDMRTPMITTIIAVVINIVLSIFLSGLIGVGGIALATSIAFLSRYIILNYLLSKKLGISIKINFNNFGFKMLVSIFIMAVFTLSISYFSTYFAYASNKIYALIEFSFFCIPSLTMYYLISYLLKLEEAQDIKKMLSKKVSKI